MNGGGQALARRRTIVVCLLLALVILGFLPLLVTTWDRHLASVALGSFRWAGLVPIGLGGLLGIWAALLLITRGGGTPAPWDPPQRLVLAGPYQYVRNPIMLGAFGILFGEALLGQSVAILLYLGLVASVVCWYVVAREEKELAVRFGETYLVYKARVPRWVPRWRRRGKRDNASCREITDVERT